MRERTQRSSGRVRVHGMPTRAAALALVWVLAGCTAPHGAPSATARQAGALEPIPAADAKGNPHAVTAITATNTCIQVVRKLGEFRSDPAFVDLRARIGAACAARACDLATASDATWADLRVSAVATLGPEQAKELATAIDRYDRESAALRAQMAASHARVKAEMDWFTRSTQQQAAQAVQQMQAMNPGSMLASARSMQDQRDTMDAITRCSDALARCDELDRDFSREMQLLLGAARPLLPSADGARRE